MPVIYSVLKKERKNMLFKQIEIYTLYLSWATQIELQRGPTIFAYSLFPHCHSRAKLGTQWVNAVFCGRFFFYYYCAIAKI